MPRPKTHQNFSKIKGIWHTDLLNEYIATRPLPKSWGSSARRRHSNAVWLVTCAINPSEFEDDDLDAVIRPVQHDLRYDFVALFRDAPDYFLALLVFARKRVASLKNLETLATLLVDQWDKLPRTSDGNLAEDKIILDFFQKQPGVRLLNPLHPSLVGKARKLRRARDKARSATQRIVDCADDAERKPAIEAFHRMVKKPDFRTWYERNQANPPPRGVAFSCDGVPLPSDPNKLFTYPFTMPADQNEELKLRFVSHYLTYGTELRPDRCPFIINLRMSSKIQGQIDRGT